MGRFIGIGILYQVRFGETEVAEADVRKEFPEHLFDYDLLRSECILRLREDIPPSEIASLRKQILNLCDLPLEVSHIPCHNESIEPELEVNLRQGSMQDLIALGEEKRYYTFQTEERQEIRWIGNRDYYPVCKYFSIYHSHFKFYPNSGCATNEITKKLSGLLDRLLGDCPYKKLVYCYITQ